MKDARMPNKSKSGKGYSDTDSGSMGSNKGASTGLKKESSQRADVTAKPGTKNPYPNGLA